MNIAITLQNKIVLSIVAMCLFCQCFGDARQQRAPWTGSAHEIALDLVEIGQLERESEADKKQVMSFLKKLVDEPISKIEEALILALEVPKDVRHHQRTLQVIEILNRVLFQVPPDRMWMFKEANGVWSLGPPAFRSSGPMLAPVTEFRRFMHQYPLRKDLSVFKT